MPAILVTVLSTLGAALGRTLLHLLTSLMTETFFKKAIVASLEKLVKRTQSDLDDQLLAAAKEAWGFNEEKKGDSDANTNQ